MSHPPDIPPPLGAHAEGTSSDGPPPLDGLSAQILPLLRQRAEDLGRRWSDQTESILLFDQADRVDPQRVAEARGITDALIDGLADGDGTLEDIIGDAVHFGVAAFRRGVSLHHVLKALDLLMAMTLFALESSVDQAVDFPQTNAANGIRLSRQLQRRGALLSLAATRGYMQAYGDALRGRFRDLRHDLRNPLGTIKSVLALMDDDSVPLEARVNPNFRAMATRNARSLEALIADRLGDAAPLLPITAGQSASVRSIACAVRRELRAETEHRGVVIAVEEGGPWGRFDTAGLELLLRDALQSTLQDCESGEQIRVDFDHAAEHASVTISRDSGRPPIRDRRVLDRLSSLAGQIGARITMGDALHLAIGFHPGEISQATGREHSVRRNSEQLDHGETRHDVRGASESHNGQASAQ